MLAWLHIYPKPWAVSIHVSQNLHVCVATMYYVSMQNCECSVFTVYINVIPSLPYACTAGVHVFVFYIQRYDWEELGTGMYMCVLECVCVV